MAGLIEEPIQKARQLLEAAEAEYQKAQQERGGAAVATLRNSCGKGWLASLEAAKAFFLKQGVPQAELPDTDRGRRYFVWRYMSRDMRRAYAELWKTFHIDGYYDGIVEFDDMPEYLEELQEFIDSIEAAPTQEGVAMAARRTPTALTIAGSDSGGGAGIQADLKTFAALGVYGASALTAITAQNTLRVTAVHEIPTDIIAAQIEAVITDIGADAVKTGMLSSSAIVEVVAQELKRHRVDALVVDPVMIAKSGDPLLREEAVEALRSRLVPLAAVVTPNIPESEVLTGMKITSLDDMRRAAEKIIEMGARGVVVKGGHLEGPATDLFYDGSRFQEFTAPRIDTSNTHGTGCTFASAIAAGLARRMSVIDSVAQAKEFVTEAIRRSFPIGQGHGPLNHFYKLWE